MEANHCFDYQKPDDHPASCDQSGLTMPILEYNNCTAKPDGCKGISIIGGYVYRGSHAAWDGKYFFGDWSKSFAEMDGQLFVATNNGGKWSMEHVNQLLRAGGLRPARSDSYGVSWGMYSVAWRSSERVVSRNDT
jgi:hypothetical protein